MEPKYEELIALLEAADAKLREAWQLANTSQEIKRMDFDAVNDASQSLSRAIVELLKFAPLKVAV